ncbi:MAG: riboflavin biosynthesis protein RibF, partial [Planctomycetaceae bacterium]
KADMIQARTDEALTPAHVAAGEPIGSAAVILGVFDGVHRGHRTLLSAVREAAAARGAKPVALVFDPPPIEVIRPGHAVERLAPLAENVARILHAGVEPILIRFDTAVREMPPEAFLGALAPGVQTVAVVMTPDTAFGRDRAGTPQRLTEIGPAHGFEVVVVDPEIDNGPISSTQIRRLLADGNVSDANRLLGRRPAVTGEVVRGDGRGRELGYPTANLAFGYRPALPSLGIYAGFASGMNGPSPTAALISVGRRPTFHDDGDVVVEAHLIDWDGDLYGRGLRLELAERLRDERRFDSASALMAQMQRDEAAARAALSEIV